MKLEKIFDKTDSVVTSLSVCAALVGTGIYAAASNINSFRDAVEITAPIVWSDSYLNSLKTFGSVALYSIPGSLAVGYMGSKVLKKIIE